MSSKLDLATQFVNSTASHIFLTGKAGTGKTTFLRKLAETTHKSFLVVAPTGIAALNAKGVTIHSQFLLPFGSFLPDTVPFKEAPRASFYGRRELASRHALNAQRRQVLRNIDLLIIDEVSMLRADLLDAIDYRLKSVKGNHSRSFGGVQLLMIGDLYQLPPIVKPEEWQYLQEFYSSPHFFSSRALQQDGYTYIELDKIFRQQDDNFIRVLNNLRDNACTADDLSLLNRHYCPEAEQEEGVITLTTHNYRADKINREALDQLAGPSFFYGAKLEGDFPQNIYPLPEQLELRVGAQVMFVKNDSESQRYYNGKLATVKDLKKDAICVGMEDGEELWVEQHEWENQKYTLNDSTKELEEEKVGSFSQYPLRLAWAITVHKSQGLTFERAVIDVGQAFAPGQVYVALSRLRSLEGLILHTKISPAVISSDSEVVKYSQQHKDTQLEERLALERRRYLQHLLMETFDFAPIVKQIEQIQQKAGAKMSFEDAEMRSALDRLKGEFKEQEANTLKFRGQLYRLLEANDQQVLGERLAKGSGYYLDFLQTLLKDLHIHLLEVDQLAKTKTYRNALDELDQFISRQISQVQEAEAICAAVLSGEELNDLTALRTEREQQRSKLLAEAEQHVKDNPKNLSTKTGRKKQRPGETYRVSYLLLQKGHSIAEVAEKRSMAKSTIESHLARGIAEGELSIDDYLPVPAREEINQALGERKSLKEIHGGFDGKYSFGQLRMVQAWREREAG